VTSPVHLTDELAQLHLEGLLAPSAAAEAQAHLAHCPDCRALVHSFRALSEALASLAPVEPPPDFTAGVMAGIAARERAAAWERRIASGILAAVAALAGALLAVIGPGAVAPTVSQWSEFIARAAAFARVGAEVAGPILGALRVEILLACAALGLPLLLALGRLMPARSRRIA
jgi:anti-sigma factor RsiW